MNHVAQLDMGVPAHVRVVGIAPELEPFTGFVSLCSCFL